MVVNTGPSNAIDPTVIAERTVKHLFNYVSGFVNGVGENVLVPMSVFIKWYENFINKIRMGGTSFLEREE